MTQSGVGPHQAPELVGDEGGKVGTSIHDEVIGNVGGPEDPWQQQIVRHPGGVQNDVLVVQINVVPCAHGGGRTGDIPGQHHRQVLRLDVFLEDIVPVRNNGHLPESTVLIQNRIIVKGDPIPPVALHQRGIQMVLILIRQIPFLQRVPDDEPGNLIRQNGIVPYRQIPQAGVGVQGFPTDSHDIGAVLG